MSDSYFWRASGVAAKRNREEYFGQLQVVNNLFRFGHWVMGNNKEETRSSLVYSWKKFCISVPRIIDKSSVRSYTRSFFSFSLAVYLSEIYKTSRTALGTIFRLSWKVTFSNWGELILTQCHTSKPVMSNFFRSMLRKIFCIFLLAAEFVNTDSCEQRSYFKGNHSFVVMSFKIVPYNGPRSRTTTLKTNSKILLKFGDHVTILL